MTAMATARPLNGTIIALMATITVFALTQGVTYPLLSIELKAAGFSEQMIGLNSAMTPLGIIVASPFAPRLAKALGLGVALIACIVATGLLFMALPLVDDFHAWMVLRFLLGATSAGLYVIGETGIHQLVPDHARGRITGIYNAMMVTGYAAGPAILSVTGTEGWAPYAVSFAFVLVTAIGVAIVRGALPSMADDGNKADFKTSLSFMKAAPALLLAAGAVALFDHVNISLLPIYAQEHGITESVAVNLLTAVLVGGTLAQVLVGWLTDRLGVALVMVGCAAVVVGGCAILPEVIDTAAVWPLCIVWGAAAFGPLTAAMTDLGRRFSGTMLAVGNAILSVTWGVGQAAGSQVGGVAMETLGRDGFTMAIGATFAILALTYAGKALRGTVAPAPATAAQAA